jgi:hypothetical protein
MVKLLGGDKSSGHIYRHVIINLTQISPSAQLAHSIFLGRQQYSMSYIIYNDKS